MNLAQVGLTGQQVDVLNGGDVHPNGRLLTIAEIQVALRALETADDNQTEQRARLRLAASQPTSWRQSPRREQQTALFPSAVQALVLAAGPAPVTDPAPAPAPAPGPGLPPGPTPPSPPTFPDLSAALSADPRQGDNAAIGAPQVRSSGATPAGSGRSDAGVLGASRPAIVGGDAAPPAGRERGDALGLPAAGPFGWGDTGARSGARAEFAAAASSAPQARVMAPQGDSRPPSRPPTPLPLDRGWVVVIAAHAGAGATSVALMIADAAAASGRATHLVDTSRPRRSGLVAVPTRELGELAGGLWRRGLRDGVTVDRPTGDVAPTGWPTATDDRDKPHARSVTVLDLGLPGEGPLTRLATAGCRTVVVARCTVPGVQAVETQLTALGADQAVVALVGPGRVPSAVGACTGPLLRGLRSAGRVVAVPVDRQVATTGLTSRPLPRPLIGAGRGLFELLDRARPGSAVPGATSASTLRTL